jgi:hypothetical protein
VYRPNTSDEEVIKQIFENRDYDLAPVRRGDDLVACRRAQAKDGKKPLIVDVGANIGAASLYAHRAFPDAQIVLVEPDRQNFELSCWRMPLAFRSPAGSPPSRHGRLWYASSTLDRANWGFRTEPLTDGVVDDSAVIEGVQDRTDFR